jgi:hypothetical protein
MTTELKASIDLYRQCERIRTDVEWAGKHLASDLVGELGITVTTGAGTSVYSLRNPRDMAYILRSLEHMFEDELRHSEELFHEKLKTDFAKRVAAATQERNGND